MKSANYSKADLKFLEANGISAEPTLDDTRFALAQRIAKHTAPILVPADSDAARLELIRLALQRLLALKTTRDERGE
jgi:hypothetical protein